MTDAENQGHDDHTAERVRAVDTGQEHLCPGVYLSRNQAAGGGKVTLSTSMAMPGMAPMLAGATLSPEKTPGRCLGTIDFPDRGHGKSPSPGTDRRARAQPNFPYPSARRHQETAPGAPWCLHEEDMPVQLYRTLLLVGLLGAPGRVPRGVGTGPA